MFKGSWFEGLRFRDDGKVGDKGFVLSDELSR